MKKIKCAAIFAMAISTLLAACDSDDPVVQTPLQAASTAPLTWDQRSWDDALWQ
jgi:ABC-type glycerol-3-phosphate transport system substrate-binding protein